jgi:predicted O-methyltransferase YrrM
MKILEELFLRRPRILNQLHRFGLVNATSQTNELELAALAQSAFGCKMALEIGTYQGVSAARIASALVPGGILYCVDPWLESNGRVNPCWSICLRHLRRTGIIGNVKIIRGFSSQVESMIPEQVDFAFIDGDHSWDGIRIDWSIVSPRLAKGAIVCLHDTVIPKSEPWRNLDSVRFYQEVINRDASFETVRAVHSMVVVRKR